MAIKKFNTRQEYNAASKSTTESTVSLIAQGNEVEFDGINVVTTEPACGDLVFKDDSDKRVYVKTSTLNKSRIPSNWTHIGYVVARFGNQKLIADKNESSAKYADVVQFVLNSPTLDGESHTATIGVRVAGGTSAGYGSNTSISYTYASTSLSGVVTALNNAIEAAQQSLGFTNVLLSGTGDHKISLKSNSYIQNLKNTNDEKATVIDGYLNKTKLACKMVLKTETGAVFSGVTTDRYDIVIDGDMNVENGITLMDGSNLEVKNDMTVTSGWLATRENSSLTVGKSIIFKETGCPNVTAEKIRYHYWRKCSVQFDS